MAETRKIAVIGAGTMGSGIALSYAMAGNDVIMYSRTEETLGKAKKVIDKSLELFIAESVLTEEQAEGSLRHLFYTTSLNEAAKGAWYVVETIAEKPDAKKELYEKLDGILDKEAIIASNTSYLNIFELMPAGRLPYSIIAHFIAPAHILKLVEIVKGPETLENVMEAAIKLHQNCGKVPVRMERYVPGFIINRMQSAMTREVCWLIENGYCDGEAIDLAVKASLMPRGLLLGLVQRMDFNGLDIVANGLKNKAYVAAPAPGEDNAIFRHTEKGELGVKRGRGFYDYSGQAYEDVLHHRDEQLIRSVRLSDEFMKDPLQTK